VIPSANDLLSLVTYAALVPDAPCEELKSAFNLEHLPVVDYPDQIGLPFVEHFVPTARGHVLRTWHMPATVRRGTVIVSMGAASDMPCYLFTARLLHDLGYEVVMYEYQGFGQSSGDADIQSLPGDLEAVLDWTLSKTGQEQVTLFGMSIGSLPSIAVAVEHPDKVNAVVLDSPVALGAELRRFDVFFRGQREAVIDLMDPSLFSDDVIRELNQPLLVYLHEADIVTPPPTVELLFERAAGPKELYRFPDLGHAEAQFYATGYYVDRLANFLDSVWPAPAPVLTVPAEPVETDASLPSAL
jgi:pimeloyl-ACP methyl ester carboxylesterase